MASKDLLLCGIFLGTMMPRRQQMRLGALRAVGRGAGAQVSMKLFTGWFGHKTKLALSLINYDVYSA